MLNDEHNSKYSTQEESINRRRHFRVCYPSDNRPLLVIRNHQFEVVNASESGLCFINSENIKLAKWVRAKLILSDGESFERESRVIWKDGNTVGIEFVMPIPYKTILREQRRLISLD